MLNTMSAKELTEWRAYELATGPLGSEQWLGENLSAIHEELQFLAHLLGQAHFTDKNHRKGPAPKPEHYPRPSETFTFKSVQPTEPEDDEEDEWVLPPDDTEEDED